ncbi:MAG: hypothetical protein A3I06_02020 [Candidatus Lindowbacteria bacterium RIFCSPLOWO2_02_FULL_62_12]|nr:MAG: hypothetical protein A3I06_02020 [Candidatus Lindowbacteria bacterium RIFCSPLOWO2_02_FULL_62_12]
MGLFGCSSPPQAPQKLTALPDTRLKGEWYTLYRETFDTGAIDSAWEQFQGPDIARLAPAPGGWFMANGRLIGKSSVAIGLKNRVPLGGDIDITLRFAHPIQLRRWGLAIGKTGFQDGYGLMVDRAEMRLTRNGLRNLADAADIGRLPPAEYAELRLVREGGRITVHVDNFEAINFWDYTPILSPDAESLTLVCEESKLEIMELKILGKTVREPDAEIQKMAEDFRQGSAALFLDGHRRLKRPSPDQPRMDVMALQAACALEDYGALENAPKDFPHLPDGFTEFLRFHALTRLGRAAETEERALKEWMADPQTLKNLRLVLLEKIAAARLKNDAGTVDSVYDLLARLFKNAREFLVPVQLEQVIELANAGRREKCYEILEALTAGGMAGQKQDLARIVIARASIAKRLDDRQTFERVFKFAGEQLKGVPGGISWLYLLKGEWLMSRGEHEEALAWLDKVIKLFSNEPEPVLWAHTNRAKILSREGSLEPFLAEFREVAENDAYQKPAAIVEEILHRAEEKKSRAAEEVALRARTGIRSITVSSEEVGLGGPYAMVDGSLKTRWGSEHGIDPGWIVIEFQTLHEFSRITLHWEVAAAREYDLLISSDGARWETVATESAGLEGAVRSFELERKVGRFLKVWMKRRATQWGYSIWEIEWS